MSSNLYNPTSWLRKKLQAGLAVLAVSACLAPAAMAQVVVPAGNPAAFVSRYPFGTYFGFERSAMIYTAAEIGSSGTITQVGFYVSSVNTPGAVPAKIYLKTVSNSTFAAATTVAAEETGATLVYDATIPAASFVANTWVNVPLTTPFAYNGTSNLEVIVETNATGAGNEPATGKRFRLAEMSVNRTQFWSEDTSAPTTTGTLATARPNIQLTGLTASSCAAATAPTISAITNTSAQLAFTPGTGATSYTVTYYPTATPASSTTVTPAPTASPVTLSGLTSGTTYTVNVVANCAAGATSQLTTVNFATTAPTTANDDCAGAVTLTPGTACTPTNGTVTGATQSQAPIACAGFTSPTARDVWYKFTATSTAHTITFAGGFDGVMEVFSGACGSLTSLACGDASTSAGETLTLTTLTAGTQYYVRYYPYATAVTTTPNFTVCVQTVPANDAAVAAIYTLGKAPLGSAVTVQAVIRNAGSAAISNVPVTLTVAGVNTATSSQLIGSIAPGATATVTFAAYTPATAGTNTLTVSLLADDVLTNNTLTYTQTVTSNTFSYATAAAFDPALSVGFPATSSAAFVARFTTPVARTLTAVNVGLGGVAGATTPNPTIGNTVYGIALSATGTLLGRTPDYVVTAADISTRKTFTFATPISLAANTTFHVGMVQTAATNGTTRYYPMATQPQDPTQTGTFFTTTATGGTLTDAASSNLGVFVIEAVADRVTGTSAALNRAISMFPNPSTGLVTLHVQGANAKNGLEVQVTNALGQVVHKAQVRDNFANQLNLSELAAGIYTVKVQMGNEFSVRQLSLTK
jgi:Secretion system C-terminal sorting domain/Fibronectin type III domain/CARDB